VRSEIVLLDQHYTPAPPRQVARYARAVDAATDHQHVAALKVIARLSLRRILQSIGG
jgi:hypothetical protein